MAPYSRWPGHAEYSRAITSPRLGTVFLFIQSEISLAFFSRHVTLLASVELVVSSKPYVLFTHAAVKPCLPSPIFVQSGFDSQSKTFCSLLLEFIWWVWAPGPSQLRFLFYFCFHFSIQCVSWASRLWVLGRFLVLRPSAFSSRSSVSSMCGMG